MASSVPELMTPVTTGSPTLSQLTSQVQRIAFVTALGTASTPGTEVTGGSYARVTPTWYSTTPSGWAAANCPSISNMPACDIQGWEGWDAAGTTRYCYGLLSPRTGTASASAGTISPQYVSGGFVPVPDGTKIVFADGYAPAGLSANVTYYVRDATNTTFRVAATSGGAALPITADTPTGSAVYFGAVETVASGATLSVGQIGMRRNPYTSYRAQVLADSPLAYYRLGETSGTTMVDQVATRNGSYVGSPALGYASLLAGDPNTAVDFSGTQRASVVGASWMNSGTVTAEAWVQPDTLGSYNFIASRDQGGNYGPWWMALKSGKVNFAVWTAVGPTGAAVDLLSTATLVAGTKYHVACTYDGANVRIYINGTLDSSAASAGALVSNSQNLNIGQWDNLGTFQLGFDGRIDEVAIYGSPLSAAKIKAHYDAGMGNGVALL